MTCGAAASVKTSDSPVFVALGPNLAVAHSVTGFGITADLIFRGATELPLYFGIESGFNNWSRSGSNYMVSGSGSITSFPIVPMVIYDFHTVSGVRPYIGAGLGISITRGTASFSVLGDDYSGSSTEIQFNGFLKPGIRVSRFFFEPRFGILAADFIFLPTVGMTFDL